MKTIDRLSPLFARVNVRARVYFSGHLCQITTINEPHANGHIHLLHHGHLHITDRSGNTQLIQESSLVILPRGGTHALKPVDKDQGSELICAEIDWGQETRDALISALPDLVVIPIAQMPSAFAVAQMMFDESFNQQCGKEVALQRLTEYLLVLLLRHLMDKPFAKVGVLNAMADPKIAQAISAIHNNPRVSWSVETLAALAGMSRARFAVHFKNHVGTTPIEYLIDWRIGLAKTHLRAGKQVKRIADTVGYANSAALTRAFIRKVGISPREWLKLQTRVDDSS
jgi:AraC-like DNA-binding protein